MTTKKAKRLQQELEEATREMERDKQFVAALEEPEAQELERLRQEVESKKRAIAEMEEELKRRKRERTVDLRDKTTKNIMDYLHSRKIKEVLTRMTKKRKRETSTNEKQGKRKRLKGDEREKDTERAQDIAHELYEALTGISFTKKQDSLLSHADGAIVRRCDLRGQSCGLLFMVLYEAKEQDNHEAITRLRIKVPNALDAELKPLITEVQKTKALKQFFVKFVEFAELAERRTTLFKQLQQKYPGRVSIPHGDSSAFLYFKPDPEASLQLQLYWDIRFGDDVTLHQTVELVPFAQSVSSEIKEVIQRLSAKFKFLVQQKGLEEAIDIVFKRCLD